MTSGLPSNPSVPGTCSLPAQERAFWNSSGALHPMEKEGTGCRFDWAPIVGFTCTSHVCLRWNPRSPGDTQPPAPLRSAPAGEVLAWTAVASHQRDLTSGTADSSGRDALDSQSLDAQWPLPPRAQVLPKGAKRSTQPRASV